MGNTDFLFARPSFLEGVARTIDLFGTLQEYNRSANENEADSCALYHDFKAVGDDIAKSMNKISTK